MKRCMLLIILGYCFWHSIHANDIYFYHIGLRDGLSQINIMSIYQDELGAMWFGSTEGLNRYNGKEIDTFAPTSDGRGIAQNTIFSIQGNKAGAIYIHADSDLIRYDIHSQRMEVLQYGSVRTILYKDNVLWAVIGDKILLYNEESGSFKEYAKLDENIKNVRCIHPAKEGKIWIGTQTGLFLISSGKPEVIIEGERINSIHEDRESNLWIGTNENGIYVVDKNHEITNYRHQSDKNSISNNQVRCIIEDNLGKIWIGTFYGLNQYDPETKIWKKYVNVDNIFYSISHSSIFALYKDRQGTVWVGTYFGGVNYFNTEVDIFRYYGASSINKEYLSFPFVGNMVQDNEDNLWICTEGGGLNCLNLKNRRFSRYMSDINNLESADHNNLKCVWYREEKDLLYIGSYSGGLAIFDKKTKKSRRLFNKPSDSHSLPNNIINKMQFYNRHLILLTQAGLFKMDIDKEQFYPFTDNPEIANALVNSSVHTFLIDKKDRLWISKTINTPCLLCIDLKTNQIKTYNYDKTQSKSIGRFSVSDIFESSTGEIFFATTGAGIYRYNPQSDDFDQYTEENSSLISNYCYCISESSSGKLILLYNKYFSFFDPKQPDAMLYSTSSRFPLDGFNYGSRVYVTKDKEIFIGGVNGLVSFFEDDLNKIETKTNVYFDKLFINNKLILPGDKSGVLNQALALSSQIELKPRQNNITIEFSSSNYLQNTVHNYEYKLDGFDEEWIRSETKVITYTNLSPGTYNLLVRESIQGKNNKIYALSIKVDSPFYLSKIAFLVYTIFLILIILIISKFYSWRTNLETTLQYEIKDKERIKELNQTKLRFFTNVSHEFRTPLTLIMGQVETLLTSGELSRHIYNKVLRIQRNANHLQNLITELLDFRKQEQGFTKLSITQVELIGCIREIFDSFKEYASKKHIKCVYEHFDSQIYVYVDSAQFQKSLYNLLSNAFKFTEENGEVRIIVKLHQHDVIIQIIDTGIGIPPESLSKVFDRFYQLEYRASGLTLGTGIGLALTKEIIQAHKGDITVESTLNKGSIFTIKLQLGSSHFTKEELEYRNINHTKYVIKDDSLSENEIDENIADENKEQEIDADKPVVLIIDDNEELLKILSENFSTHYHVYTAADGEEGLNAVLNIQPDLVISDIMMPKLSGKEMCYKIKNNINTSHIPVVLLTSQVSDNQIIDGFMFGADAYVTKPFNIKVLISYCNNILRNRKLLIKKVSGQSTIPSTFNTITEHDQLLIDKAIGIIKENFSNSEFDMNKLGVELGMGRSKLYTKIKEITGFTPNEFTLNLKLQEAINLLENQPQMNVSEIALQLGFSSTKYFSKCFKTFYGTVPQDWRRKAKGI